MDSGFRLHGQWGYRSKNLQVPVQVPLCARVSRMCPVCVPAPPGVFLPVIAKRSTQNPPHSRPGSLPMFLS